MVRVPTLPVLGIHAFAGRSFAPRPSRSGGTPSRDQSQLLEEPFLVRTFGNWHDFSVEPTVFTIIGDAAGSRSGRRARRPDIHDSAGYGQCGARREVVAQEPGYNWLSVMAGCATVNLAQARAEVKTSSRASRPRRRARRQGVSEKCGARAAHELEPAGNGFDELRLRFSQTARHPDGVVAWFC